MSFPTDLRLPGIIPIGDYSSFSDETDTTHRYMVIGGFTCGTSYIHPLHDKLSSFQRRMPFKERLEWKAITRKNKHVFSDLVHEVLDLNSRNLIDIHALVVDMSRFDHHTHNDGDREVGFDKMLFQSFYANFRRYPKGSSIRCFHGNRDCRYPIGSLRDMLNRKAMTKMRIDLPLPFVDVRHLIVKQHLHVQMADFIIGCIGAKWNRRKGLLDGSPKDEIANLFEAECPAAKLAAPSPSTSNHFDIWEFQMGLRA